MYRSASLLQVLSEADREAATVSLTLREDSGSAAAQRLATAEHLAAVDRLASRQEEMSTRLERIRASWATFEASVRSGAPSEDLSAVIDAMLELEETLTTVLELTAKERAGRAREFSLPVATKRERARSIAVLDRMAAMSREAHDDIQAKRLWAVAKRAELEDPGDAPVFDDFDELVKYLDDDSR